MSDALVNCSMYGENLHNHGKIVLWDKTTTKKEKTRLFILLCKMGDVSIEDSCHIDSGLIISFFLMGYFQWSMI